MNKTMVRVVVESPFAGSSPEDREINITYLRSCLHDCIVHRTESPYASHALLTQPGVLNDDIPDERSLGIQAGFLFREVCARSVFYLDRGWSKGMQAGFEDAANKNRAIEFRAFLLRDAPSFTILFGTTGDRWTANVLGLPGGFVIRDSRAECVEALRAIAAHADG